jgi:hypothetical protein
MCLTIEVEETNRELERNSSLAYSIQIGTPFDF